MLDILRLREQYGDGFASRLPDGRLIPWKPLTISEYLEYEHLFQSGVYPHAYIENEIFKKGVLDKVLVDNIDQLRAGVVSMVATAIMSHSGPQSTNDINELLEISRCIASQALHTLVTMVCVAFPAYTPDSLYKLDYPTFMLRVAQSERKLLEAGIIPKPLVFENQEQGLSKNEKIQPPPPPKSEELANLWQKQQNPLPPKSSIDSGKLGDTQTIISKTEMAEHQAAYTGHEKEDRIVLEDTMVKTTAGHYGDYIEQIQQGQKIQMKTVEQRIAEAESRAKESEIEYKALLIKRQEAMEAQSTKHDKLNKLLKERKAKRAAKRKKR